MRPLVAVRRAVEFDARFLERDALFWPLARAARSLALHDDFPPVDALAQVFDGDPPVRFAAATPRRRRGSPVDVHALYDARITIERAVPTRPRCWHDLMNALVWGTFPRAKLALHARQHRLIAERIGPDARGLPPQSRELDAPALVDEGGVVILASDPEEAKASLRTGCPGRLAAMVESGAADALVFGHAVYESLALGVKPAIVAALVLGREGGHADLVRAADHGLSVALHEGRDLGSPRDLTRVEAVEARPVRRLSHSERPCVSSSASDEPYEKMMSYREPSS